MEPFFCPILLLLEIEPKQIVLHVYIWLFELSKSDHFFTKIIKNRLYDKNRKLTLIGRQIMDQIVGRSVKFVVNGKSQYIYIDITIISAISHIGILFNIAKP